MSSDGDREQNNCLVIHFQIAQRVVEVVFLFLFCELRIISLSVLDIEVTLRSRFFQFSLSILSESLTY